jgi:hypothetical protein
MKVTGDKKLIRQMRKLPKAVRRNIVKTMERNTEEAARVARTLAPDVTGQTRDDIFTKYEYFADGLRTSVEAAQPTKEAQQRALAIEFGRENGDHGTTPPQPYIRPAQGYLEKKHAASMKRAINKAAKETFRG